MWGIGFRKLRFAESRTRDVSSKSVKSEIKLFSLYLDMETGAARSRTPVQFVSCLCFLTQAREHDGAVHAGQRYLAGTEVPMKAQPEQRVIRLLSMSSSGVKTE